MAQELQEVVVTAQKRAEDLQDVGVSIRAVEGPELEALGLNSALDLGHAVTGLQLNSGSGGNAAAELAIRGVATSDFSPQQESPNSLYVDGVYVSAPNSQSGILFDVDRIEVLRGPQGALFGRNSIGGLVDIITRKPTTDFEAYVDVAAGSFGEEKLAAAIGGQITDWMQGRLAVAQQSSRGYDENRLAGFPDLNSINFKGVRGALQFELTDKLTALVSLYFTRDNNVEGFYGHVNTYYDPSVGGRPAPLPPDLNAWGTGPGLDLQGYRSPYAPSTIGEVGYIGHLYRDFLAPTLRLDWALPSGATVTSLTNFSHLYFDYDESCSGAPQTTCRDPYHQTLTQWSEELRVSKATPEIFWVAGLYGLYISQKDRGAFYEPYYSGTPFAFGSYNDIYQKVNSAAVFGQVEYLFSPHWRATLGARISYDEKDFSSQTYYTEDGNGVSQYFAYNPPLLVADFSQATVGDLATRTETDWSGKTQLDYIPSGNALLYLGINRGVKAAGFNANISGLIANRNIPFSPEHALEYELGAKITTLDNRLRVNGAAFYYDYHDYQAYQLIGVEPYTSNNQARFAGAELEVQAAPMAGLELQLGVIGLSTEVFGVHTAQLGVLDQQATDAPKWSGNALVSYSWRVGEGTFSALWSSDYVGGRYHSVDNTPSVYVASSIGHSASLRYSMKHWQLTVGVTNLTNAVRQTTAYDLTQFGYAIQTYQPPRWWTVSFRYEF